jgi:class 3 adenylate cyclase
VGDCYVAVTGLPKPRKDHAVVMVKFARDCLQKMNQLTKKLQVKLGPDVCDLNVRIGIHSGVSSKRNGCGMDPIDACRY